MDAKALIEAAKANTYELLATVLPGAALVTATARALGLPVPADAIVLLGYAYAVGLAVQGIGSAIVVFATRRSKRPAGLSPSQAQALALVRKEMGDDFPQEALLDVCLTRIGTDRSVYDKFVALRDTSRGLAVVTLPVVASVLVQKWATVYGAGGLAGVAKVGALLVGGGLVTFGFIERYRRFSPLAAQIVHGQFLAKQFAAKDGPPKAASAD